METGLENAAQTRLFRYIQLRKCAIRGLAVSPRPVPLRPTGDLRSASTTPANRLDRRRPTGVDLAGRVLLFL
jgi:hypothetical protein